VRGGRSLTSFAPQRMLPPALLAACDAWVTEAAAGDDLYLAARDAATINVKRAGQTSVRHKVIAA